MIEADRADSSPAKLDHDLIVAITIRDMRQWRISYFSFGSFLCCLLYFSLTLSL